MNINKIFVYGTLLSGMSNHYLISHFIKTKCNGKTKGILFDLPYGYPALIPGEGLVYGEVFELGNLDQALKILDDLEDFDGVVGPHNVYNRVIQEVCLENSEVIKCYVYIWTDVEVLSEIGQRVPDGNWKLFIGD